jgi:transposase InsO family protein
VSSDSLSSAAPPDWRGACRDALSQIFTPQGSGVSVGGSADRKSTLEGVGPAPGRDRRAGCDPAIQRLAVANAHYGYRRIAAEMRRAGWAVNRKRVLRLMRLDNLLCLRKRSFVPVTSDSRHGWRVVPNLARDMIPTGLDQLWVADITDIRLQEEFAYLAIVLDAFSRRVVG